MFVLIGDPRIPYANDEHPTARVSNCLRVLYANYIERQYTSYIVDGVRVVPLLLCA